MAVNCNGTKNAPMALVEDDDPVYLSFWNRVLTDAGIENFKLVGDPIEAKKILESTPCRLLISDIIMPHIGGYELVKFMNEHQPECTVILTTAYSTDLSRFDLSDYKFHLLHKPYTNLVELKKFLKHLMAGDTSFDDISEDSFSENRDYPHVTEWKL